MEIVLNNLIDEVYRVFVDNVDVKGFRFNYDNEKALFSVKRFILKAL